MDAVSRTGRNATTSAPGALTPCPLPDIGGFDGASKGTPSRDVESGRRTHSDISPPFPPAPVSSPTKSDTPKPITRSKRGISSNAFASERKRVMAETDKSARTTVNDVISRLPALPEIGPNELLSYHETYGTATINSIVSTLDHIADDTVLASAPLYLFLCRCQAWFVTAAPGWGEISKKLEEMRPGLGQYTLEIVEAPSLLPAWAGGNNLTHVVTEVDVLHRFFQDIDHSLHVLRLEHDARNSSY